MPRFIALLRGVNVGKAKRVPMADFRALLEGLGCTEVTTLLNSGNAVFSAAGTTASRHASNIAAAIAAQLGVEVPVIVKSARELAAVIGENTIDGPAIDASRLLVAFAPSVEALAGLAALAPLVQPPERFVIGRHAAYLYCANGILDSKAGEALLGKWGKAVTTRNWATTQKLHALIGANAA